MGAWINFCSGRPPAPSLRLALAVHLLCTALTKQPDPAVCTWMFLQPEERTNLELNLEPSWGPSSRFLGHGCCCVHYFGISSKSRQCSRCRTWPLYTSCSISLKLTGLETVSCLPRMSSCSIHFRGNFQNTGWLDILLTDFVTKGTLIWVYLDSVLNIIWIIAYQHC